MNHSNWFSPNLSISTPKNDYLLLFADGEYTNEEKRKKYPSVVNCHLICQMSQFAQNFLKKVVFHHQVRL